MRATSSQPGGASIIAAGAGHILERNGTRLAEIRPDGQIIAAGGGQVIASGAGMFQLLDQARNVIAAGSGNVIAAGGGNFTLLAGGGAALRNGTLASLSSSSLSALTPGTLGSVLSIQPSGLRAFAARARRVTLGSGRAVFKKVGQRRVLTVKINRRGRSALAKAAKVNRARVKARKRPLKLRLTFTTTYRPKKGKAVVAKRTISLVPTSGARKRR